MFIGLIQRYTDVAKQLSNNYGDRAWTVCVLAEPNGKNWPVHGIRLDAQYPTLSLLFVFWSDLARVTKTPPFSVMSRLYKNAKKD